VVNETNSTVDSRYLFTGREFDEEIDLYYYRARYYNSEIGRFISIDPIGFESGTYNLYGYVGNNPISNSDSSRTTSVHLQILLSIAQPKSGKKPGKATIYHYPESADYSTAFGQATFWFYAITESSYSQKTPSNRRSGVNIPWLVNAPLNKVVVMIRIYIRSNYRLACNNIYFPSRYYKTNFWSRIKITR
jgi:RHS repeat-associated protein